MATPERPSCIAHWSEVERPDNRRAPFARHFGLTRLGIHHQRLPPGGRTSFPHAESAEEEFVYVLEGEPDVWLDGYLYRLKPGDGVGFPAGTGIAHTFLNNTDAEVHLLVVGEADKPENRIVYPINPERRAVRDDWWDDYPVHALGPHDGMPDLMRAAKARRESE